MEEFLYNLNGKSYYYQKYKQQTNTINKAKRPIGKKNICKLGHKRPKSLIYKKSNQEKNTISLIEKWAKYMNSSRKENVAMEKKH